MLLRGHVQNGVVIFDAPVVIADGTEVQIEIVVPVAPRSLAERLAGVIGKAEGLPEDASRNVNHYLYGHPKQ